MSTAYRREVTAGAATALLNLPFELLYGALAVAPLGAAFVGDGMRAALWSACLAGVMGLVLRFAGGMILGTRPSAALILASMAAVMLQQPGLAGQPDAAAQVFDLMLLTTCLAGLAQVVLGWAGVGRLFKYVPYPVIAGLMAGLGLLMARAAIKPLLGVDEATAWTQVLGQLQPHSLVVGGLALALCNWPAGRLTRHVPAVIWALLVATLLHVGWAWVAGSAPQAGVGAPPGLLPAHTLWQDAPERWPNWLRAIPDVLPYALAIAAFATFDVLLSVSAIETGLLRRVAAGPELSRQGWTNVIGGVVGATPAIASVSRVAMVVANGASTPWSGLAFSATLAAMVVLAGPWLGWIPPAATAGILLYYAWAMVDQGTRRMMVQLWQARANRASANYQTLLANGLVVGLVAAAMVLGNVLQALATGVVAAVVLFLLSSLKPVVRQVTDASQRRSRMVRAPQAEALLQAHGGRVVVMALDGPLFFGTAERVALEIEGASAQADWLILDFQRVKDLDATGAHILMRMAAQLARRGKHLMFSAMGPAQTAALQALGGASATDACYGEVDEALEHAEDALLLALGQPPGVQAVTLAQTALAQGLSAAQVAVLGQHLHTTDCTAGQRLFRCGDVGGGLFVATQAVVDVVVPAGPQQGQRVASIAPGNVFGELALLDRQPRSADAVVRGDGPVWALTPDAFERLSLQHPDVASRVMFNLSRVLAGRLRATTSVLSALAVSA